MRALFPLLAFAFLTVLMAVASAPAEMYIHLNTGEIITLPYSKHDVEKITYSGGSQTGYHKSNAATVTLMAHNYPQHAIRHRNFIGEITEIHSDLDRKDATFKVVRGLADPAAISFESINYPGYYLRHQNFQIKLHKNDGSRLFQEDATFRKVSGLADYSKFSFESLNYPNYFIRHKNFLLYIERGSGDLYRNDTTFSMTAPAWRN
jgi:hypothetical protein